MARAPSPGRREFICNLIPDIQEKFPKSKPYKSAYSSHIHQSIKSHLENPKLQHRTMGFANEEKPDPKNYMKKGAHTFRYPKKSKDPKKFDYDCGVKRNPIPRREDWLELPSICDNQNMITRNAICAIIQPPYEPERIVVDTKKGDKFLLKSAKTHSGLEKRFIYKDGYGEVPKYIRRRIRAVAETKDAYERFLNEKSVNQSNYYLTADQRQELIDGLKKAWDRFNSDYLKLSLSNDTLKFMRYKKYLEKEMISLEKDIQLVENHKYIFVKPH